MFELNTVITYPLLLIKSTTNYSFKALGKLINKSGDTVRRLLHSKEKSLAVNHKIACDLFIRCSHLTLSIDDTLLRKMYAKYMVGAGRFFDTKLLRKIMAYRLIVGALTNGKYTIPIGFGYLFAKELTVSDLTKGKLEYIQEFYRCAHKLFQRAVLTVAADGLFASLRLFEWALEHNIRVITRMHSNRVVIYKGKKVRIDHIEELKPRGRQMARTILVCWHTMSLWLTAERRIDKHGQETIVYLIATYKVKPIQYVKDYKLRWPLEKFFRTSKQHLGISNCYSTQLEVQEKHVAASLLAYSLVQSSMKKSRLKTPEEAIRASERKNYKKLLQLFHRPNITCDNVYA